MQTRSGWILLPENRAAHQAVGRVRACVVRATRGEGARGRRAINPLFLHGPAGTGKSHLVEDLLRQAGGQATLTASLLQAADLSGGLPGPGEELDAARSADLVVVEDLHHLPARAVEAFVGLVDHCLARERQLVCTATAGPAQLSQLPGRLTSRLSQGLVVGLGLLGPDSRLDYLRARAGGLAGAEVLGWVAQNTPGSVRQLEGVLVRLRGLAGVLGRPPQLAEVEDAFRTDAEARTPTVERIAQRVGRYFRVELQQLCSGRRSRDVLAPRQVAMYLARQLTPLSLEQIGAYFGGRDHSTVLHACRKVEQALGGDARLSGAVRALRADLA
jgi:chromosomal replication initiator protein